MSSGKHALDGEYGSGPEIKRAKQEEDSSWTRAQIGVIIGGSSSEADSDEEWGKPTAKKTSKKKQAGKQSPRNATSLKRKAPAVKVASRAYILSLASDVGPGKQSASQRLADIDSAVLSKIKKALALGGHQGTGEAEAKRAMRLATKMMALHNVDQADILAAEEDSEKLKRAGQSTVVIRSTNPLRGVVVHSWSVTLADAIDVFFDCKCYSVSMDDPEDMQDSKIVRVNWTFYAAYAFEMVYNLILTWSAQNKTAKGRSGKNNYCHGVADGLYRLAIQEQKEEEKRVVKKERGRLAKAREAEEEERKRAVERLEGPGSQLKKEGSKAERMRVKVEEVPDEDQANVKLKKEQEPTHAKMEVPAEDGSSWFGRVSHGDGADDTQMDPSDDDDDGAGIRHGVEDAFEAKPDFEDKGDVDWMLHELDDDIKPAVGTGQQPNPSGSRDTSHSPPFVSVEIEEAEDTPWSSAQQLTLFRKNASSIADEYLKQTEVKLHVGPKRLRPNLKRAQDMAVYRQGQSDAKNIDVKRKRIKGVDED